MSGIRIVFDGGTPRYFDVDADGVEVDEATATPRLSDAQVTLLDIRAKARQAIIDNKTFLSIGSPTNAQSLAQVKALTRQMNAVIKLVVGDLMDASGT